MSKSRRERRRAERARSRPQDTEAPRDSRTVHRIERWEWIALFVILGVGFLLRVIYLNELEGSPAFRYPAFDAAFHDHWARCLVSGDWTAPEFHNDPRIHEAPFFRPPGYPYFLAGVYALTGQDYLVARVVQMLIGLSSCVLAFFFGRSLFAGRVGLTFAALMAVYWIFIYFEGELLAPVLLVFLTLATMSLLARWLDKTTYWNTITAGVVLGLFALVRPNALVLSPVALVWIWWVARRRKDFPRFRVALLGFPLGIVLAIAPATIRNYTVADDLVLITSNAGINLYIGNNEYTDCVSANVPLLGEHTTAAAWTCFDEPAIVAAVERIQGRQLKSSEVSRFFAGKAFDYMSRHPGRTLGLMWKKGFYFWGPAEISNNKVIHFERAQSRVLKFLPGFALALALAIVGVLLLFLELRADRKADAGRVSKETSRRLELTVLLLGFVAAYFATHLPFFIAGRYRIPIIPILLLFGAYGIERVRLEMTARRVKNAVIWMGILVVAYLVTTRQFAEYRPDLGMWHFDRGDAYRKQGRVELARLEFRKAVELSNEPSPIAYNNLGAATDQLGRHDEAVGYFERALEIKPDYLEARRNLVAVLLRMKRADLAYEHQLEIVRLDPRDAVARFNLGINLLLQSRLDEAIGRFSEAVELNPSYYNAQYHLARSLAMAGRTKEAIARYLVVMKLGESNVEARFELAKLLAQTGDKQQAITHLRRVLTVRPDHSAARQLLSELESD